MNLSIVIPTFNRKLQLAGLLDQLQQQRNKDIVFQTVVAVDGSTDGTFEMLANRYPDTHVVKGTGNWWFTRSLNEGCKYAVDVLKADLILTLNDDVHLSENYLRAILKNYAGVGPDCVIGSCSYSLSNPNMITFSGFSHENKLLLKKYKYKSSYSLVKPGELKGLATSVTLPTRGLLIPSALLKKINFLDEKNFPQYASDYDLVLRAAKAGAKVYVTYDAPLLEDMKLTSGGNPRLAKSLGQYCRNVFLNKYSSNYFFNGMRMSWRHGIKLLFPFYLVQQLISVPYVYYKYRLKVNKEIQKRQLQ